MSKSIQIVIADKRPSVVGTPVIVCGNSDYVVNFTFDGDWTDLAQKVARFVYVQDGTLRFQDVVFTGTTVAIPILRKTKEVMVGVYAGELRTTTPARILCDYSIICGDAAEETAPLGKPSLQAQIGDLGGLETKEKSNLVAAINWLYGNIPLPTVSEITASSTNDKIPTAKAVYDAIEAKFNQFTNVAEEGA